MEKSRIPRKLSNEAISHEPEVTQKDISYKKFKNQLIGYNKDEVDDFLNAIIRDYAWFERHFTNMCNEINALKRKNVTEKEVKLDDLEPTLQQAIKRANSLYDYVKKHKKA